MTVTERFCYTEYIIKFTGDDSVNDECISFVYENLKTDDVRKNNRSLREGIQLRDMHTDQKWCKLFEKNTSAIYNGVDDWVRHSYYPENIVDVTSGINNMWINYSPPGAYNVLHHHPTADISGVFYLKADKNSGDIIFPTPYPHELSPSSSYRTKPERNMGVLFYSGLMHYVDVNRSDEDRISVSFNIILTNRTHRFG